MNIEKIKEQCFLDTEDPGQIEIGQRCVPRRGQQLSCVTGGDYHEADSASCEPCTSNPPTRVPRSGTPVPQSVTSGTIIGPKESFTAFSGGLSKVTSDRGAASSFGGERGGLEEVHSRAAGLEEVHGRAGDRSEGGDTVDQPPLTAERPPSLKDPPHTRVEGDLGEAASDPFHGRADSRSEGGNLGPIGEAGGEPIPEVKKERINIENECKKMKNIKTLVLEGCGTSGFYILGYIQKAIDIYKLDLNSIKNYIASSSGTITSFLLSIGYTPMEILIYVVKDSGINSSFEKIKKINIANMLLGKGIISFEIIKKIITDMTLEKIGYIPTFSDIKKKNNINLVFSVYNITKQMTEYMSYKKYPELSCIDCIEMSCAIPVIFPEIVYNRQRYIDGAVGNCFPVEMLSILKGQESTSDRESARPCTAEPPSESDRGDLSEVASGSDAVQRAPVPQSETVEQAPVLQSETVGNGSQKPASLGPSTSETDRSAAASFTSEGGGRSAVRGDLDFGPSTSSMPRVAEAGRRAVEEATSFGGERGEGGKEGDFKKNTLAISLTNRHIKEEICYIYENPLKYLLSLFLIYVNEIKKNKKINKDNNIIFVDLDVSNSSITNTVLESNIQILDMFSYGYKQCRK